MGEAAYKTEPNIVFNEIGEDQVLQNRCLVPNNAAHRMLPQGSRSEHFLSRNRQLFVHL